MNWASYSSIIYIINTTSKNVQCFHLLDDVICSLGVACPIVHHYIWWHHRKWHHTLLVLFLVWPGRSPGNLTGLTTKPKTLDTLSDIFISGWYTHHQQQLGIPSWEIYCSLQWQASKSIYRWSLVKGVWVLSCGKEHDCDVQPVHWVHQRGQTDYKQRKQFVHWMKKMFNIHTLHKER